jgi:hypothetical protein
LGCEKFLHSADNKNKKNGDADETSQGFLTRRSNRISDLIGFIEAQLNDAGKTFLYNTPEMMQ